MLVSSLPPPKKKQVKDVLFEPVRKTQDAMFFFKADGGMLMPCGPKQPGAVQTTMQELASKGLAAQVTKDTISSVLQKLLFNH
jgi:vacuolar protein-sorting-associated protein 4